jgi:hypothetical protein
VNGETNGVTDFYFADDDRATVFTSPEGVSFSILGSTGSVSGPVPEPASWALLLTGFGGMGAMMRRRRARALVA